MSDFQIAIIQHINFGQFMDALLGAPNNVAITNETERTSYDPRVNGGISMGFGTAGFRLHTYISGFFSVRDPHYRQLGALRLRDVFHNPKLTWEDGMIDSLLRGMASQPLGKFDVTFTKEMTEWLFPEDEDSDFGMDIFSLNVQRGRDHQIPSYTAYK